MNLTTNEVPQELMSQLDALTLVAISQESQLYLSEDGELSLKPGRAETPAPVT
jgi:hypothetical protein